MGAGASIGASMDQKTLTISNITAFEAAAKAIKEAIEMDDKISYEEAFKLLNKYETAISTVTGFFPGAQDGKLILSKAASTLISLGCNSENTLFAQSICPDEINHEEGDITTLFSKHMVRLSD
jgi:prophage DNA circulation protein